ncbi:hypothetical protein D3C73_612850 [compost metagenome]
MFSPSARRASAAGRSTVTSCRPMAPPSPAWGLSAAIARRGAAIPKSRFIDSWTTRATRHTRSPVTSSGSWSIGTWMVTRQARRFCAVSIMTGPRVPLKGMSAVSSAMNSVWPGKRKPDAYMGALAMGAVTRPEPSPDRIRSTPRSIQSATAGALAGSGRPGTTGAGAGLCRTGMARPKTAAASAGLSTASTGWPWAARASASPTTTKGVTGARGPGGTARIGQARAMISGPTPAGSPIVTMSGRPAVIA